MIPSLMIALAIVDLAFAGFRAAAGRNGLIRKRTYFARATFAGAIVGLSVSAIMALATYEAMTRSAAPAHLFTELIAIGTRMAAIFGAYAALVFAMLAVYTLARDEWRTLATVAVLGPFTLARPWIILLALVVGILPSRIPAAIGLTVASCARVLGASRFLDWHYASSTPGTPISPAQRAIEIGRPLVLLAIYIYLTERFGWIVAPFAVVVVFSAAILVHDLIHNALYLPRTASRIALSVFAQLLMKSGHALGTTHRIHHQRCLEDVDEEGRVVHAPVWKLVLTGPWLALRARIFAFREGASTRGIQLVETLLNVALLAGLGIGAGLGSVAAITYLAAVILVTVSAPIWGAKIPHSLPDDHPIVRWLRRHVGRFTPAACSVVFHELHHRSPRVPVALLACYEREIAALSPSPCASAIDRKLSD